MSDSAAAAASTTATSTTNNNNDWCTIESDPGVFTEMLETLGCQGVELQELWSLDDDSLKELGKVYGLIFLFQWKSQQQQQQQQSTASTDTRTPLEESEIPENLFFAHQVTTNACATQAILSVILNAPALTAEQKGSVLSEFQAFTQSFPPSLKGMAISSSEEIKTIHNSFGRPDGFLQEGKFHIPTGDEEAFHFIAYVPVGSTVYELDGLQKGPLVVGTIPNENTAAEEDAIEPWLALLRPILQERMGAAIKVNLMAVTQDKRVQLREKMQGGDEMMLAELLAQEEAKREQWKLENQRRRHNYVPLCIQILKELARQGKLPQLVEEAKGRVQAKRLKMMEAKA